MVGHAYDCLPEEACGLLLGRAEAGRVELFRPCVNAARSARVYTVDPRDFLRVDREAEELGLEIIGVMHSHTHTPAWPSPTDVAQAPDPGWHYVIVSLGSSEPVLRSFRIREGEIDEEEIQVLAG